MEYFESFSNNTVENFHLYCCFGWGRIYGKLLMKFCSLIIQIMRENPRVTLSDRNIMRLWMNSLNASVIQRLNEHSLNTSQTKNDSKKIVSFKLLAERNKLPVCCAHLQLVVGGGPSLMPARCGCCPRHCCVLLLLLLLLLYLLPVWLLPTACSAKQPNIFPARAGSNGSAASFPSASLLSGSKAWLSAGGFPLPKVPRALSILVVMQQH